MQLEEVRRLTITALFTDDALFDQLVLKGGNAMSLVHHIGSRASLDLDFSLEADFANVEETRVRMEQALHARFNTVGLIPFDVKLVSKPSIERGEPWWGGYELQFKLIDDARHRSYGADQDRIRREAFVVGPKQQKVFTVDFSKHEYTSGKVRVEMDHHTIYVYPPAMIAVEKLRAICQQMADYAPTGTTRRARARDFLDIFAIVNKTGLAFGVRESKELVALIFSAKQVPLALLEKIAVQRDFHRTDWPSVQDTVAGPLEDFDFYFDFVLRAIEPLHVLWKE